MGVAGGVSTGVLDGLIASTVLGLQSRFGDELLTFEVIRSQKGTGVLKGSARGVYSIGEMYSISCMGVVA